MAINGIGIGLSFSIAIMLGPLVTAYFSVPTLFLLSALLGCVALSILWTMIPHPTTIFATEKMRWKTLSGILHDTPMLRILFISIFTLHVIFSACLIGMPIALQDWIHLALQQQGHFLLTPLLLSSCLSFIAVWKIARYQSNLYGLRFAVFIIAIACLAWSFSPKNTIAHWWIILTFFTGFSFIEAILPALTSEYAPSQHRGAIMGLFSFGQFLGIFVGAVGGGWIYGHASLSWMFLVCSLISLCWLGLALSVKSKYIPSNS